MLNLARRLLLFVRNHRQALCYLTRQAALCTAVRVYLVVPDNKILTFVGTVLSQAIGVWFVGDYVAQVTGKIVMRHSLIFISEQTPS